MMGFTVCYTVKTTSTSPITGVICHAGLDPAPSKPTMDSHFRGNDMQPDTSAFRDYLRECLYARSIHTWRQMSLIS
ncbi:MAG: hypothetical protein ACP5M0_14340 [Desulfomonilaceae bacterium]